MENIRWIFSGIGVVVIVAIGSLIKKLLTKHKVVTTDSNGGIQVKSPPRRINPKVLIDIITDNVNNPNVEFSIYIRRCWYPNKKPNVKEFIKELSIEDPICFECKTPFINIGSTHYKECTGPDCSLRNNRNFKSRIRSANYRDWNMVLNTYIGKLNKEDKYFNNIWKKYEDWYIKNTNNKMKKYSKPLRLSH